MCGIFGIIFHGKVRPDPLSAAMVFSNLAVAASERGTDATGMARIDGDGYVSLYKNVAPSTQVVRYRRWWRLLKNITPTTHAVLGHTRWGTHGGNTWQNAHPFTFASPRRHMVGTHNGIIRNHLLFGPHTPFKNDSANLFYGLAHADGWVDLLRKVQGSMALAFATEGQVHLVRNFGSPCELAYAPVLGATVYASTRSILEFGAQHGKVVFTDFRRLPPDELWSFQPNQYVPEVKTLSLPEDRVAEFSRRLGHLSRAEKRAIKRAWKRQVDDDSADATTCAECGDVTPWQDMDLDKSGMVYICPKCQLTEGDGDWCEICGEPAHITQLEYDQGVDGFVCDTCRQEIKEADAADEDEQEIRMFCTCCGREFGKESLDVDVFWNDSLRAFICMDCYRDPASVFAPHNYAGDD